MNQEKFADIKDRIIYVLENVERPCEAIMKYPDSATGKGKPYIITPEL